MTTDEPIFPVSTEPPEQETPKRKRRKKRQPIYLQPEEVDLFFRVIDNPRDRAVKRASARLERLGQFGYLGGIKWAPLPGPSTRVSDDLVWY